jgi:macrolide-specific efflux system membrane fusion protein
VAAYVQSSVAPQIAGTVTKLVRIAGDWVNEKDPIIELDKTQLLLSLKLAQANLDTAKLNAGINPDGTTSPNSKSKLQLQAAQKTWDADLALSKIGGISGSDLDTAQANLEAAKIAVQQDPINVATATLQVQQAQLNLDWSTLRAPFSGQIVAVNVQPGEYVTTSTPAVVMVSRQKIVNFNVPPSDVVGLTHGAKISFNVAGKSYPLTLIGVPSAPVNGLVPLQGSLPGGFTEAYGTVGSVVYSQVIATGTLVPIPAIQTLENSTYVFTIKDNKAARANITILADSGIYAAVTGVTDGDSVVVNPPPGLLVGAPVRVLQPVGAGNTPAPPAANGGGH